MKLLVKSTSCIIGLLERPELLRVFFFVLFLSDHMIKQVPDKMLVFNYSVYCNKKKSHDITTDMEL